VVPQGDQGEYVRGHGAPIEGERQRIPAAAVRSEGLQPRPARFAPAGC
jgi:hypothetical protein